MRAPGARDAIAGVEVAGSDVAPKRGTLAD